MLNLDEHLNRLETAGLLRRAAAQPDLEYLFRHALIQDAAYSSLLRTDRRRLHRQVALALESCYPDRLDELAPLLGHHFAEAHDRARARVYLERAADLALASHSNQEATAHYQAALSFTSAVADRARLLAGLGEALTRQSRYTEELAVRRDALLAQQTVGDGDALARSYAGLLRALRYSGDTPGALRLLDEARAAVAGYPESVGLSLLFSYIAQTYYFNGLNAEARDYARQAEALAVRFGDPVAQITALLTRGSAESDQPAQAFAHLQQAATLAESVGLWSLAAAAHHNASQPLLELGMPDAAHRHYDQAARLNQRIGDPMRELFARAGATSCLLWLGRGTDAEVEWPLLLRLVAGLDPAMPGARLFQITRAVRSAYHGQLAAAIGQLEIVRAETRQGGDLQFLFIAAQHLSQFLLFAGAWAEARAVLEEVLPLASHRLAWGRHWSRYRLCQAAAGAGDLDSARRYWADAALLAGSEAGQGVQTEIALAEGALAGAAHDWPAAQAAYTHAAALQAAQGLRWYRAHTLQMLAAVQQAAGTSTGQAAARATLAEAHAEFLAMDMPHYAAEVARAAMGRD